MSSFEQRLRRRLGYKSWFHNFDDEIQEVSAHYDDLVAEAKDKGMSSEEAAKVAEQLLGDPKTVVGQITKKTPKGKGLQLQRWAAAFWLFFAISPRLTTMGPIRGGSAWDQFTNIWADLSLYATYLLGALFALGIYRARALAIGTLAACIALIPGLFIGYQKFHFESLAKVDQRAHLMYDHLELHRTVFRTEMNNFLKDMRATLTHPNESNIANLSKYESTMGNSTMIVAKKSSGAYLVPTGFQKVLSGRTPVIFFSRTNSLDHALQQWNRAEPLAKVFPSIIKESNQHFVNFPSPNLSDLTLVGQTKQFSIINYQNFGWPLMVTLLSLLGFGWAMRQFGPRRFSQS